MTREYNQEIRLEIVEFAKSLLGCPAIKLPKGSNNRTDCNPNVGFTCSGLFFYVFEKVGFSVPKEIRYVNQVFDDFGTNYHTGGMADLVFFSWSTTILPGVLPRHMGIMVDEKHYIHAASNSGIVALSEIKFRRFRRVHPSQRYLYDPIGFKALTVPGKHRYREIIPYSS